MKLVYICSPYAGDIENNVEFAKATVTEERRSGMRMGLRVMSSCEELWVCGDKISSGIEQEISEAKRMGIPIRYVGELEIRMAAFPLPESGTFPTSSCEIS